MCGTRGVDDVRAEDACPAACGACDDDATVAPTTASSDECSDSASWYYKKSKKTCATFVSKKPKKNCKRKGVDDVRGRDACPETCGGCDAGDEADDGACQDSSSWYSKKSKNGCDWASKKSKNCKKKDEFKVKALEACPMTCGACGE